MLAAQQQAEAQGLYATDSAYTAPPAQPARDFNTPVGQGLPGQVWVVKNNYSNGGSVATPYDAGWDYPGGGGGLFDGLTDFSNLGSSISDTLSDPNFQKFAIISGGITGLANSGLLAGAAEAGSAAGSGLAGNGALALGDATAYGAFSTPATGALTAAGTTAGLVSAATPAEAAATTAATAPATNSVLADSAANSAGYGASSAGAGLNAGASVGGAMTLDEALKLANDNKGLIGAALGAASSGSTTTSTTADKSPWAPAQEWMKANLARGQQLQKQYQDNPFSAFQQQAYNNSAGLGNQFRGMVNGMTPQLNAFRPYQRTPQSQVATPYNFGTSNLGMTKNPFGG